MFGGNKTGGDNPLSFLNNDTPQSNPPAKNDIFAGVGGTQS